MRKRRKYPNKCPLNICVTIRPRVKIHQKFPCGHRFLRKNTENVPRRDNLVKAVFYAIVVSVLASAWLSLPSNPWTVTNIGWIWDCALSFPKSYLSVSIVGVTEKLPNWTLPLAYFIFYTCYFYDEWKYGTKSTRESEIFDLLAWSCFIIQAVTLKLPEVSVSFGIIGCGFATLALAQIYQIENKERTLKWGVQNV